MPLPHYNPYRPLSDINDGPRNGIYCGYCLSSNMKVYEGNGVWEYNISEDDKLECLDCGWKGGPKDCKLMTKKVHDKIILNINRRKKIEKIKNKL